MTSTLTPSMHATLFRRPYDVVLMLWMLYGCQNDVVCLLGGRTSEIDVNLITNDLSGTTKITFPLTLSTTD